MNPHLFTSPALAGGFFTTSANWPALFPRTRPLTLPLGCLTLPAPCFPSLRIFSVFSVTKLISGSRKYSEATQRPFSRPGGKIRRQGGQGQDAQSRDPRMGMFWGLVCLLCITLYFTCAPLRGSQKGVGRSLPAPIASCPSCKLDGGRQAGSQSL